MSVLRGSQYTLVSPTFVGSDGETPEDCASTPTCTVTRDDGTALTAAVVTAADGLGAYTAAITTTHTDRLDLLHIEWTGTAGSQVQVYPSTLEVAGGWYVTIPEVRAEPDLSSTAKYPVELIRQKRDEFESIAEEKCGVAFVPRFATFETAGNGRASITLPHLHLRDILSVTIDGVAQTVGDFSLDDDLGLVRDSGTFTRPSTNTRNVVVTYTHGMDVCPAELKRACLTWLRSKLTERSAGMPNAAQVEAVDGGRTLTFSSSTVDRVTGIDSVDTVLNRLDQTQIAVG